MSTIHTIQVVTRTQDNGDGGFTTYAYNNEDDLIADHPKSRKWSSVLKKDIRAELTEEERKAILDGDDEYENGYIGTSTIKILIEGEKVTLAKPISFHGGQ